MRWASREGRLAEKVTDEMDRRTFDIDDFVATLVDGYGHSTADLIQFAELLIINTAHKADSLELWSLPTDIGEAYARAQALRDLLTSTD